MSGKEDKASLIDICTKYYAQALNPLFIGMDKTIGSKAVQSWLHYFCQYNDQGNSRYMPLAQEASEILHIPCIPIYNHHLDEGCLALTMRSCLLVDDDQLDKKSEVFQKHVLLHELIHCKYADWSMRYIAIIALAGINCAGYMTLCNELKNYAHIAVIPLFLNWYFTVLAYCFYQEYRADEEAAYALNCAECIRILLKSYAHVTLSNKGYLGYKQYKVIERHCKKTHACCKKHKHL
jgi:hypothetical protein